ncbi:MAG: hypothetical protein ACI4DU_03335 [Lachnospiraceae bacterium]
MKKRIPKCQYGYLKDHTRFQIILTLLYFSAAFGVLFLGMGITGVKYNLLTIVAVLGLLPSAKALIESIMFLRAKKYCCPDDLHKEIEVILENADGNCKENHRSPIYVSYDHYMTSYEKTYPIYSMACKNRTLIGFGNAPKFDYEKCQEHIRTMLGQNGFQNVTVKIFDSKEKYLRRLKELADTPDGEEDNRDEAILHLMSNLSL